jgi:hypothetical protein
MQNKQKKALPDKKNETSAFLSGYFCRMVRVIWRFHFNSRGRRYERPVEQVNEFIQAARAVGWYQIGQICRAAYDLFWCVAVA